MEVLKTAPSSSESPNLLHRAILFWSFQQTAHASRVEGVVGEGWMEGRGEEEEENFSPTIYKQFDKNTITAPFLWCIYTPSCYTEPLHIQYTMIFGGLINTVCSFVLSLKSQALYCLWFGPELPWLR